MKTRNRSSVWLSLVIALLALLSVNAAHAASYSLEGLNKGNTNTWSAGNLQDWQELDFIPCRVRITGGNLNSQTFTISFPHLTGTTPGFENLYDFVASSNVVFVTLPTLSSPANADWSYTFTVNVTDNSTATIQFFARLAAGAHLNTGSSLMLSGNPSSMGNLQVHKPAAGPGAPDLGIKKTGPTTAAQGSVFAYTLTYTNSSDISTAVGAQVSDILPSELIVQTNSLSANAHFAGNTIFWDLTNVAAHANGQVSFQVQVKPTTPVGRVITNFSQVLSSENDAAYADNTSKWLTTVTGGCLNPPLVCVGDKTVECGASWTFDAPTTSDSAAANSLAVVSTITNGLCGNTFSATRTWQATDACGNTAQCSQTVTVIDTTAPVISCATDKTVEAGAAWIFDAPTVSDSCGTNVIAVLNTTTNAVCGNAFTATRTWQATDACGNTAQCSQTVTVQDTTAPAITCADNKSVECGVAWSFDVPALSDGTLSVVSTTTNGLCGKTFSATRIWKGTDACGNVSQCSQTVTVVDTTAPVIICAGNKTVEDGAAWTFDAPTATDICGTNSITILSTTTNVACGNTFSATRTWQATDACGNSSQCSQTVTVNDTTAPTLTCAGDKTVECGSSFTFDAPTASDGTITILSTTTNAACGNTFATTRTWQATDACGNTSQCSQTITVVDTTAPAITCASGKTVEFGTAWTFDAPSATDVCGTNAIAILSTVTNPACGNTFSATRTWQATDACGNTAQCSQTVTVVDTTAPAISCPANKTVEYGAAWNFGTPTATDLGGTNSIIVLNTVTNAGCGNTFTATRTWKATDACGNASQCSQTVTVTDTTAPTLTCVGNKTVECGAAWTFDAPTASDGTVAILSTTTNAACGNTFSATRTWKATDACGNASQCSQTVTVVDTTAPVITCVANKTIEAGAAWTFDAPSATDVCGTNAITVLSTTTNVACGNTFTATRTWRATDACGNSSQCSQTVTVVDTTAPTITCVANKTVECGSAWTFNAPTASDGTVTILSTTTNAACGNTFSATRTWKATDACGNVSQCSQTVTVVDTTAPVITCVANKTIEAGAAWTFDAPSATDVCGTNVITILSTTTNVACGNTFTTTRTWKATDACGNSSQCSQTVTVVDTTAPTITCSPNKSVECGAAWTFDAPTTSDGTVAVVSTTTNAACGNTFRATRTWSATDACGNVAQCSQTVTVVDTTAPVITCVANKTVENGAAWNFDAPTATDTCGTNSIGIVNTVTNALCGNTFSATRTWKATDACGNSSQCSQTVTVVDTTAPTITCVADKTVECGATWTFDAPSATDLSGASTIAILSTVTNAGCGQTFSATRTWRATDACGNLAQCSQTVTVVDTTAPVITCVADKTVESGAAWNFDAPTATDICGTNAITILSTTTNASCGNAFTATRTWQATDACGNSSQCSQTVTVQDTTAPTLTCSTDKTIEAGTPWNFDEPSASDGTVSVVSTASNTNGCIYARTRTWQAVDACGNVATCSQTITFVDTTAPTVTILSPTNGTSYIAPGNVTIVADVFDAAGPIQTVAFYFGTNFVGEVTNGAPYVLTLTNVPAGDYQLRAVAIDACGNAGTSTAVSLNVLEHPPLTIITAMHFNPQTGLLEQKVRVFNPTLSEYQVVRVYVSDLTGGATVWNKSGSSNGVAYVQSNSRVLPGSFVDFVIEYYVPTPTVPNPTLRAELVEPVEGGGAATIGTGQNIARGAMLSNKTFLLEFNSATGGIYYVQYSSDLKTWKTAQPSISGTGTRIQWIDNGLPKTESAPSETETRFYRVIAIQ